MLGALFSHAAAPEQQRPIYQNAVAPPESRVEDLFSRMTLEEKIDMIGGFDSFYIRPNERLGIPGQEGGTLKELKGFAKISLKPGETKTVDIELDEGSLSYYHPKQNAWQADPGRFEVLIASSSKDVGLTKSFVLEK
jgi:hypothetical protein